MTALKSLNDTLTAAVKMLDEAATHIRDLPLEPRKENIKRIGKALTLISEVQLKIYEISPELEPDFLRQFSKYPGENRKFGDTLLQGEAFCEAGEAHKAITLFEDYISGNPPDFFLDLARNRIERIKKDFRL